MTEPYDWLRYDCMSLWLNQAAAACGLEPEVLGGIITDATQMAEGGVPTWEAEKRLRDGWPGLDWFWSPACPWGNSVAVKARGGNYRRVPVAFWGPR